MMKQWTIALASLVLSTSGLAETTTKQGAELVAAIGIIELDPQVATPLTVTEDRDTIWQLGIGAMFSENLQYQFRYADLGRAEVNDITDIDYNAWSLALQYTLPVMRDTALAINVLGGVAIIDADSRLLNLEEGSDTDALVGASLDYAFSSDWRSRLEVASYGSDLRTLTLGVARRF